MIDRRRLVAENGSDPWVRVDQLEVGDSILMLRWPYLGSGKEGYIQVNTPWTGSGIQMTTIQFSTEIGSTQTVAIQIWPSNFFSNGSTQYAYLSQYAYFSNTGGQYQTLHSPVDGWVYIDPQYTTDNYCKSGEYIPIPWTVSQFSGNRL